MAKITTEPKYTERKKQNKLLINIEAFLFVLMISSIYALVFVYAQQHYRCH